MSAPRRGFSLVELLVAIPLIAVIAVLSTRMLLAVHRNAVVTDGALGATRELRHGAHILMSELRNVRATDLVAWTDTSFEFNATVGVGVVCSSISPPNTVVLVGTGVPSASAGGATDAALITTWNQSLQGFDSAHVWLPGSTPSDTMRRNAVQVLGSASTTECQAGTLRLSDNSPSIRLTLKDTIRPMPAVGTPVRIFRRVRYSLYRSGDGDWYLGRRTRSGSTWDVIQPVAGPLHAPRDNGVVIRVSDTLNSEINSTSPSAIQTAARITIYLRAPKRAGRASPARIGTDSLRFSIAVRSLFGVVP